MNPQWSNAMKRALSPVFLALFLAGCGSGEREYGDQPLSFWIAALEGTDLGMQNSAKDLLAQIGNSDPMVVPKLCQLVKKGNYAAAEVLGRIGPVGDQTKVVVQTLAESVKNKNHSSSTRIAAAKALPRFSVDAKEAVPAVLEMLKDSNAILRAQAAETLGQIPGVGKEATPALLEARKDTNLSVRAAAIKALERTDPEALGLKEP
jgi:HEAT repeat protein